MEIPEQTLTYLRDLRDNNNREWFERNKHMFKQVYGRFKMFAEALAVRVASFDERVAKSLSYKGTVKVFRIYRDARFSRSKVLYKTNLGVTIAPHGMEEGNAGYYFHVQPNGSFAGGGVYMPQSPVLKNIRKKIAKNSIKLRVILDDKDFKKTFGQLGDYAMLKTKPRDYDIDHPAIDLLRYQSYTAMTEISDKEVLRDDFMDRLLDKFKKVKPLNDFLSI